MREKKKQKQLKMNLNPENYLGEVINIKCPKCNNRTVFQNKFNDKWCDCGYTNIPGLDVEGTKLFKGGY